MKPVIIGLASTWCPFYAVVISFHDQGNLNPPVLNGSYCFIKHDDEDEQHAHMMHIKNSTPSFIIIGFASTTCAILCMDYFFIICCYYAQRMERRRASAFTEDTIAIIVMRLRRNRSVRTTHTHINVTRRTIDAVL